MIAGRDPRVYSLADLQLQLAHDLDLHRREPNSEET
jgi:hypothetical protein